MGISLITNKPANQPPVVCLPVVCQEKDCEHCKLTEETSWEVFGEQRCAC